MEKKRKAPNQKSDSYKRQKTDTPISISSKPQLLPDEVLIPTLDGVKWIGPSFGDDTEANYKGFVRGETLYRVGQCVYMTTEQEEPFIAEIVRLYENKDGQLRADVRWSNLPVTAQRRIERERKSKRRNEKEIFNSVETDSNLLDSIEEPVIVTPRNQIKNLAKYCADKDSYFYNLWYRCGAFFGTQGELSSEQKKAMDNASESNTDGYNPYTGDAYLNSLDTTNEEKKIDDSNDDGDENYSEEIVGHYVDTVEKFTDPLKLIRCRKFSCMPGQKPKKSSLLEQPFTVKVYENALLLIDFHSHLVKDEIIGFLGGSWDPETNHLQVKAAFPAQSCGQGENNVEIDPISQLEINSCGMTTIGWYHSHTTFEPDPSLRDIENQTNYQVLFRQDGGKEPFVGAINGTFDVRLPSAASICNWFWVRTTKEEEGIPMKIVYEIQPEQEVTEHVFAEAKKLVDLYKEDKKRTKFKRGWKGRLAPVETNESDKKENQKAQIKLTMEDKFRYSLRSKLPSLMDENTKDEAVEKLVGNVLSNWAHKQDLKERKKSER